MGTAVLEALVMLGLAGRGCPQTPEQKAHGGESLAAAATAKKTSLVASEAAHRSCLFSGESIFWRAVTCTHRMAFQLPRRLSDASSA